MKHAHIFHCYCTRATSFHSISVFSLAFILVYWLLCLLALSSVICCGCRQHTLRIPTGDIQDPVKRDLEKSVRERQQLMPTRLRTPPVAGKETLSTILWDKLDSTPCGHHMDRDGNYVTKALTPEDLLLRRSAVTFDDYNVATGDCQVLFWLAVHRSHMSQLVCCNSNTWPCWTVLLIVVLTGAKTHCYNTSTPCLHVGISTSFLY